MVERHTSVEVIGSSPILVLFYFFYQSRKGDFKEVVRNLSLATSPLGSGQEIAMAIFIAIVQGILMAGLSTYVNQIIKQANKDE